MGVMVGFDALIDEAEHAPIDGWDFSWLEGRAVEERPSWRYYDRVRQRVRGAAPLLELQAGTGTMIGSLPSLPRLAVATEGFPPSIRAAAPRLRARNVHLVSTSQTRVGLPFARESFGLIISRHPVEVWWDEIARVLQVGGRYFAQHVGPHSLRSLSEFFLGPLPEMSRRDPERERTAAESAGLVVETLESERLRTAFFDIGAVVYFLRVVPWIVPGFDVALFRHRLRDLHDHIEREGAFHTTASRTLIEAIKRK